MGTIVLSPQDYLSSPHNRQNYYFQSATKPDTGRRRSRASMVPFSTAEDCARHDYSCGSPPGDGLLPIPQPHGQARALSKRPPFPTKLSSVFCTPPAGRIATSSPSSTMKSKLSRSVSAILPTPLVGSPPAMDGKGLHLLKGRLPFKIVQGNGPGISKVDALQNSNARKSSEARCGTQKMSATNGNHVNVKVKGSPQGSRPTLKPLHDGALSTGRPRKVDLRNERNLERSHSVKGPRENGGIPVVTILQRPQSKEAAAELLTKFFQKSAEQEVVGVEERLVDCMAEDMRNHAEMIGESERSADGLSDCEAVEDKSCHTVSSPCRKTDVLGAVASKYLEGSPVADAVNLTVSSNLGTQVDVVTFSSSKRTAEDVGEQLASWERWAGPCYINSPPPSALPLPRFSRKQLKLESLAASDLFDENVSKQVSTPPSSISSHYACLSDRRQLGPNSDATKELKRILNLDLCRT